MLKLEAIAKGEAALREQYKPKNTRTGRKRMNRTTLACWPTGRSAALQTAEEATEKLTATEQAYVKLQADIDSGRLKLTKTVRMQIEVEAARALQPSSRTARPPSRPSGPALAKETTRETAQLEEQLKRERDQVAARSA